MHRSSFAVDQAVFAAQRREDRARHEYNQSKQELRAMLEEAVRNTAKMQAVTPARPARRRRSGGSHAP
jgi:hypothetical protein